MNSGRIILTQLKIIFQNAEKRSIEQLINAKLALANIIYVGFDNRIHAGQIICSQLVAQDIRMIFFRVTENEVSHTSMQADQQL